jgi:uncharacterized protein YjeT (DUF2065 family)
MSSQRLGDLAHRRGNYGVDAPYVPSSLAAGGAVLLAAAAIGVWVIDMPVLAGVCLLSAACMFASMASYLYTNPARQIRRVGAAAVASGTAR